MAVTATLYTNYKPPLFLFGNLKVMLLTSAYTPNVAHAVRTDVSSAELVDASYTAGGVRLAGPVASASSNIVTLDARDVTFPTLTGTVRYAVFYADTGDEDTDLLLAYWDLGEDVVVANEDLTLVLPAAGLFTVTT